MNQEMILLLANLLGLTLFIGGIALCVRFDQQGKTRRRELEHVERMRAIELGQPPDDAEIARCQALGAIGVGVSIASFSAATLGSCFAFVIQEPLWRFLVLAVVWPVCGLIPLVALPLVIVRLGKWADSRKN